MRSDSSLEVALHDGVVHCSLCKHSVPLLANFIDSSALVEFERLDLINSADLGRHLVLHVLVEFAILQLLVLLSEAQLLERVDLLFDAVVFSCGDSSVQLAVIGLKKGTIKDVFSFTLSQFSLEKDMTLRPVQIKQMMLAS